MRKNLKRYTSYARTAAVFETLGDTHVVSQAFVLVAEFARQFRETHRTRRDDELGMDPLERDTIPEGLEDDEVFSQYICPITRLPIRHPVFDPTTATATSPGTMYERSAIEEWVNRHHTSPESRRHLERVELIPAREAQTIIDNRLRQIREEREAIARALQEVGDRNQEQAREAGIIAPAIGLNSEQAEGGVVEANQPAHVVGETVVSEEAFPEPVVQGDRRSEGTREGERLSEWAERVSEQMDLNRRHIEYLQRTLGGIFNSVDQAH